MKAATLVLACGLAACSTPQSPAPTAPPMPPPPMAVQAPRPKPNVLMDTNGFYLWDVTHMSNGVARQEIWVSQDRPPGIVVGAVEGTFRLQTTRDLTTWQTLVSGVSTGRAQVVFIDVFGDSSRFYRLTK